MNCQDFDAILLELVRGEAPSSAMEDGRAHAASCARCAASFSDQQSLSAALEALAARAKEDRAPQRIDWALLAVFRRQHARAAKPGVQQRRGRAGPSSLRVFENRWAWAAAAIVIGVAGVVTAEKLMIKPKATPLTQTLRQQAAEASARRPPVVAASSPEPLSGHSSTRKAAPRGGAHPRASSRSRPAPAPAQNYDYEWATNFYPLPYGSGLDLDEGWEMVRVNMSASALASLGVPVVDERSAVQNVKAEVVLGGDGTPRAIRFIQ